MVGSLSSVSTWSPLQVMAGHSSSDILIPVNPADPQSGTKAVVIGSHQSRNTLSYFSTEPTSDHMRHTNWKTIKRKYVLTADKKTAYDFHEGFISPTKMQGLLASSFTFTLFQWALWRTRLHFLLSASRRDQWETVRAAAERSSHSSKLLFQGINGE